MKVPTTAAEIVVWILMAALTLCFGGLIFFVRRFIQHNDEHHAKVDKKLSSLEDAVEDNGKMVASSVHQVRQIASDLERGAVSFQKEINKELHEVHKGVTAIKADVGTIQSAVVGLQDTVIKHQGSLSLGAKAMQKFREEHDSMKTVIKKISEELIIISDEKKKK